MICIELAQDLIGSVRFSTSGTMCFCIATWSVSSVKVWLNA